MGHLLDIYNAHRAYRTVLLSTPADKLAGWEGQNPDVMQLLAYVRKLKRTHGK